MERAVVIGGLLLAATWPAAIVQLQPIIDQEARTTHLPAHWIASVIAAESGGRTTDRGRKLRSPVGAMGLMQVMPATWAEMTGIHRDRLDPDRPADNVAIGSAYLLGLYRRFGLPGAFAAYQAGPAAYQRAIEGRGRLSPVTQRYVAKVMTHLRAKMPIEPKAGGARSLTPVGLAPAALPSSAPRARDCNTRASLFICLSGDFLERPVLNPAPRP
jgi:hypothetical protein